MGAGCTWYDYMRWLLPRVMYDRQVGSRVRVVWCMINPRINPKVLGSRGVVRDWGGLIFIVAVNFKPPTPAPPPPPACSQPLSALLNPASVFMCHRLTWVEDNPASARLQTGGSCWPTFSAGCTAVASSVL